MQPAAFISAGKTLTVGPNELQFDSTIIENSHPYSNNPLISGMSVLAKSTATALPGPMSR